MLLPLNGQQAKGTHATASQHEFTDLPFHDTGTSFRRSQNAPVVRITKSSCNPGRGSRVAQKSASMLRMNAKNQHRIRTLKNRTRVYAHELNNQGENLTSEMSVERIIQDLGDQQSELNLRLLKNVERRADFKSRGLLQATQIGSDYDCQSTQIDALKTATNSYLARRQAFTSQHFFSQTHLEQSSQPNLIGTRSQLDVMTMNQSPTQNIMITNELESTQGLLLSHAALDSVTNGAHLSSVNADLAAVAVMDPVKQMVTMQMQGRLNPGESTPLGFHRQYARAQPPRTSHEQRKSISGTADVNGSRARVTSQNANRRKHMDQRAVGIYYDLRSKKSKAKIDVARESGDRFKHDDNSHIVSFKQRYASTKQSPLGVYLEQ